MKGIITLVLSMVVLFGYTQPDTAYVSNESPSPQENKPINSNPIPSVDYQSKTNQVGKTERDSKSYERDLMTTYEFGLSIGVLSFGLILIILEIFLIKNKVLHEEILVRFIVITIIITATLFLITAGYDNNQIAPAIGLFGTVAGYLLGRGTKANDEK